MIDEYDLLQINKIITKESFNDYSNNLAKKIALNFIKRNSLIDYDLLELVIIKLYNKRVELDTENVPDYISFNKRFKDWVFMAIQDLGNDNLSNRFKYDAKLLIQRCKVN